MTEINSLEARGSGLYRLHMPSVGFADIRVTRGQATVLKTNANVADRDIVKEFWKLAGAL